MSKQSHIRQLWRQGGQRLRDREVRVEWRGLGRGFDRHLKCGWRAVPHSAVSFRNRAHELCERLKRFLSLRGGGGFSDELAEALVIQADVSGIAVGVGDERGVLAVEAQVDQSALWPGEGKALLP